VKRLLNTLYVTTQGAYLARDGDSVAVRVDGKAALHVSARALGGVVCFGQVSCSPPMLSLCAEQDVAVSFLSQNGRFWGRVQSPVSGNVRLRREQYRRADRPDASADLARSFLAGKIANCRAVLRRAARDHAESADDAALAAAADALTHTLTSLARPLRLAALRGIEGDAAGLYFGVFDHLVVAQKADFFFRQRSRRPPLDNMNALLSFLYTLLAHDVASALEAVGLDPQVGFLHRDRPGRPSLALDVMEELRPVLADRLALNLINRRQVAPGGFQATETGAVVMDDRTRKVVLVAYQERKREELRHPFLDERIAAGLLPHAQALLLSRHLRDDLDAYPPFLWR